MIKYRTIINKFKNIRILVVGDLMLDRHIKGSVSRISPEAPVPVVLESTRTETVGGAANVAHNLAALGAQVFLSGVIGDDTEGRILKRILLKKKNIDVNGIKIKRNDFRTITKTRVIAQHQQVVRVDREIRLPNQAYPQIVNYVRDKMKDIDAVIISDYGKGLINYSTLIHIKDKARKLNKIITVDPKVEHFYLYDGVNAITPNRKEAENALRDLMFKKKDGDKLNIDFYSLNTDEEINQAGQELLRQLRLEALLITLGERGMRLFERSKGAPERIQTHAQDVYDVTGAGDAVISVFTLARAAGASFLDAAKLANFAAGIVVGKLGAVAVSKKELLEVLDNIVP